MNTEPPSKEVEDAMDRITAEAIENVWRERVKYILAPHCKRYRKSMNVVSLLKGVAIGFLIAAIAILAL